MKIGFIGTGNMGGALINGIVNSNSDNAIVVYDTNKAQIDKYKKISGVSSADDIKSLIEQSDIIILAVKPNIFEKLLPEIKSVIDSFRDRDSQNDQNKTGDNKLFVSIAAGISIKYMSHILGSDVQIVRIMPNLAAMAGEGMSAVSRNNAVDDEPFSVVMEIFNSVGKAVEVDEKMIDTVIGISGSSPAYVFMFIEALVNCAIEYGMSKDDARIFASQAVLGSAKTVMESDEELSTLVDNVCSPGGTTIEAVMKLRENGFQDDIREAMIAAIEKSEKMTK